MSDNYQAAFEYVRKTFFPKWDGGREWRIEVVDDLEDAGGRCCPEATCIKVLKALTGDHLLATLIHEICHAITYCGHGVTWAELMERSAKKADKVGMSRLAILLREDKLAHVQIAVQHMATVQDPPLSARVLYDDIENIVMDLPAASFEEVMMLLRQKWHVGPKGLDRFRRCRKVYDQAKADYEEEKQKAQRFREAEWLKSGES
jgi:hypothetical protein